MELNAPSLCQDCASMILSSNNTCGQCGKELDLDGAQEIAMLSSVLSKICESMGIEEVEYGQIPLSVSEAFSSIGLLPLVISIAIERSVQAGLTQLFRFEVFEPDQDFEDRLTHLCVRSVHDRDSVMPMAAALNVITSAITEIIRKHQESGTQTYLLPEEALRQP